MGQTIATTIHRRDSFALSAASLITTSKGRPVTEINCTVGMSVDPAGEPQSYGCKLINGGNKLVPSHMMLDTELLPH